MKIQTLIIGFAVLLSACTQESTSTEIEASSDGLFLSMEQAETAGLKLSEIEKSTLSNQIIATGYLDVPPAQKALISAKISGYVTKINVLPGEKVEKGQVLATLSSSELLQLKESYVRASSELSYLKSEYERLKELAANKIAAQKEFLQAESAYFSKQAEKESSARSLSLLGIDVSKLSHNKLSESLSLRAPMDGEVVKVNTVNGKFVEAMDGLFEMVNPDHMHLELKVYERDLANMIIGQKVNFAIPQIGEEQFEASIHLISDVVDMSDRTVNVHAHLDNPTKEMRVGAYAQASIRVEDREVLVVPEEAVRIIEGKTLLYILREESEAGYSFEAVEIEVGVVQDGMVEVKNMTEETKYVSKGSYYLSAM